MHELYITQRIVHLIEEECQKANIVPKRAVVEIGALTSFKKEPVLYYFKILKQSSKILNGCHLVVNEVQGKVKCNTCEKINTLQEKLKNI